MSEEIVHEPDAGDERHEMPVGETPEVSVPRHADEYDNVSLSGDENDNAEEEPRGIDLDSNDTETEDDDNEEMEELDDDNENEGDACDEDNNDDDGEENLSDEGDGDGGEGEAAKRSKKRPAAVRRHVEGDEIKLVFFPLGTVAGNPKALIGATLVGVRTLSELLLYEKFQETLKNDLPVLSEKQRRVLNAYDHYEQQDDPDANDVRHYCQRTFSADLLAHKTALEKRTLYESTMKSLRSMASHPRRWLVYCEVVFPSVDVAREHSCPLLAYAIRGKTNGRKLETTNWQAATEFPHLSYDVDNASANAAMMPESLLKRCNAKESHDEKCCVRQPIVENALFFVLFEERCAFPRSDRSRPTRYNFRFAECHRIGGVENFFSNDNTVQRTALRCALKRTNFFVPSLDDNRLEFERKPGYGKTTCQELCEKKPFVVDVMCSCTKRSIAMRRSLYASAMHNGFRRGTMSFDDAVRELKARSFSRDMAENWQRREFSIIALMILPATAPSAFWRAVDAFGFSTAIRATMDGTYKSMLKVVEGDDAHEILTDNRFAAYELLKNQRLMRALVERSRFAATSEDLHRYVRLSADVNALLRNTDARLLSRPDVTETQRNLAWPSAPGASLGAFEVVTQCNRSTTLCESTERMVVEANIANALRHAFDRKLLLCRSASVEELNTQIWMEMFDDTERYLVLVVGLSEFNYWRHRCRSQKSVTVVRVSEIRSKIHSLAEATVNGTNKFSLVVPRVDRFTYQTLSLTLVRLCTGVTSLKATAAEQWARSLFALADAPEWLATQTAFRAGGIVGGRVIIGALAFQNAHPFANEGCIGDDIYFSAVLGDASNAASVAEHYAEVELLRDPRSARIKFSKDAGLTRSDTVRRQMEEMQLHARVDNQVLVDSLRVCGEWCGLKPAHFELQRAGSFRQSLLPIPARNAVVVVFDVVGDNVFYLRAAKRAPLPFGYVYNVLATATTSAIDLVLKGYFADRNERLDGLTPRNLIRLLSYQPAALLVLGSRRQSLEERLTTQQHAPWFMRPPTRNNADRAWYDNSEQSSLSALCWMLRIAWSK